MTKDYYKDFYFEVRDEKERLIATFRTRWMAEEFVSDHHYLHFNFKVIKILIG